LARHRLSRIDHPEADDPRVFTYSTKDGLATDFVVHVTADPAGRIYVTHMRGIDRPDPAMSAIKHYSTADGLPAANSKWRSAIAGSAVVLHHDPDRAPSCPPMVHPSPSRRSRSGLFAFQAFRILCPRSARARCRGSV
jgi:hypothetical protein